MTDRFSRDCQKSRVYLLYSLVNGLPSIRFLHPSSSRQFVMLIELVVGRRSRHGIGKS